MTPLAQPSAFAIRWARRLAIVAAALLPPGCQDSSAPDPNAGDYIVRFDASTRLLDIRLDAPSARARTVRLLPVRVRIDSTSHRLHAWVSVENLAAETRVGPRGVRAFDFAPSGVWPVNAGCVPPDSTDLPDECIFWHGETYGEDQMLSPGEISAPAEWILRNPAAGGIRFRASLWWPHVD